MMSSFDISQSEAPCLMPRVGVLNGVSWGVLVQFDSHCTKSTSGVDLKHDPT